MPSQKTKPSPVAPARWEKGADNVITRTSIFDLRATRYTHPSRKTERDFYVVNAPDWVNVVALTPDHRLVLVRQFRFGINDFSLEIPGGVIDPGETDPVAAGLRELREETGYESRDARLLGSIHPNPAFLNNSCHLVFAGQCEKTTGVEWDEDEEIEVSLAPVDQVYEWARTGKITHSLVLDALFLFAPYWEKLK
ncbi:ADP-ribose pyrophosphatase [Ereboglobus sp. PH5-5]|uniref:NUDIX hydrolase n=1 Tax=Ereboglobus sp. PH5-5 TaxID=2940529 RepID=UPI002405FAF8|nr:NUDIX hydrolase [Ereboglobus sp. PH5-5]MDF9834309.1 ADP-ribose pyrophosphatase [Ereboglobus sp. PH5-5]